MAVFATIEVRKLDQVHNLRRELQEGPGQWVFRGQKKGKWPLQTTLDRTCNDFHGDLDKADKVEKALLREFRRRLHHYESSVPKRKDYLEWWSLMQHHGAPTRLLDFSYSFFVAFYFAVEYATGIENDPAAIWGINCDWIKNSCASMRPFAGHRRYTNWLQGPLRNEHNSAAFARVFFKNRNAQFVCHATPFRLNPRLTIQRGLFIVPGSVNQTFEANLRSIPGHDTRGAVIKVLLAFDKNERRNALIELHDMGMNRAALFPGLDGFASSLSVHQPTVFKAEPIA